MNDFTRFGIDHLSPSSINAWKSSPGIWALRYLASVRDKGNAAMWRGTAVEAGYAAHLRGATLNNAYKIAAQTFITLAGGEITEEIEAENANVKAMLFECLNWKPPSMLLATQIRVEHFFDDIPIPVMGYVDLSFEHEDVDLKTTKACPSSPRGDHIRQVSLYRAARKKRGGLLYVTGKKHAYYPVDDASMKVALDEMREDALSLMNFLSNFKDRATVLKCLPIDWESFMAPKVRTPLSKVLAARDDASGFEFIPMTIEDLMGEERACFFCGPRFGRP